MVAEERDINSIEDLKPNDIVKVCPHLEIGCSFQLDGIHACCLGTTLSPLLISNEEIQNGITYETIVERRKKLFAAINGLDKMDIGPCATCTFIKNKQYKDVNFEYLGGYHLPSSFNIQHYTECNERCAYCCYAQNNDFRKPQYNIIDIWNLFKNKGKLRGNNWIDFSGGETAMLKNFDEIINYMMDNNMGTVVVYTNASIYSEAIERGLKENKIILTTSVDTGLCSTYKNLRGANVFPKVLENLIRYRNTGTNGLWLKYVVCETNRTEDDMYSFLTTMLALRPNRIMFCPDFPYGDREIPEATIDFIAKLWYLVEKYIGNIAADFSSEYGEPKWKKYQKSLFEKIEELRKQNPIDGSLILKPNVITVYESCYNHKKITFLQQVFSIQNEGIHKVIRFLGLKLKIKRGIK